MDDELRKMRAAVEQLPQAVTLALRAVAWRTAIRVKDGAQARVPVDSGYTRDNIHVDEDAEHKQFLVIAGTDRPRVGIALHTSKRSGRIHTQKVTRNNLPVWLEYGTIKMPARPFMRPALEAEDARYRQELEAAAEQVVRTNLGLE